MSPSGVTIFVVDDHASVGCGIERLLRSAGWTVEVCASAKAFLKRPTYLGTGCMPLDVCMPGMTGPELQDLMTARRRACA